MAAVPRPRALRTTVVIDYQNVHMTAYDVFSRFSRSDRLGLSRSETRIRPILFAQRLIDRRNERQRSAGFPLARLEQVKVFRGLPSEEFDERGFRCGLAEQQAWMRDDPRVEVQCRELRYTLLRDRSTKRVGTEAQPQVIGAREKGIDVLCALAVTEASYDPRVDLILVASHDRDLEPAIESVQRSRRALIEGFQWWAETPGPKLRSELGTFWVTRLDESDFRAVRETRDRLTMTDPVAVDGLTEALVGHQVRADVSPCTRGLSAPLPAAVAETVHDAGAAVQ
ncbi:PIN domain-containing protein [Nocardia suismassiliense]|uniref:NYN domain-containing protein n=1 Tax=Nocardia suismassiliense TaxID=2077092 RepID=UPI000D1D6153|nr:NYN domain-containing protein [Nocardia suismassiliense]